MLIEKLFIRTGTKNGRNGNSTFDVYRPRDQRA